MRSHARGWPENIGRLGEPVRRPESVCNPVRRAIGCLTGFAMFASGRVRRLRKTTGRPASLIGSCGKSGKLAVQLVKRLRCCGKILADIVREMRREPRIGGHQLPDDRAGQAKKGDSALGDRAMNMAGLDQHGHVTQNSSGADNRFKVAAAGVLQSCRALNDNQGRIGRKPGLGDCLPGAQIRNLASLQYYSEQLTAQPMKHWRAGEQLDCCAVLHHIKLHTRFEYAILGFVLGIRDIEEQIAPGIRGARPEQGATAYTDIWWLTQP